ncbi:MAG: tRNA (adenosine(37)-N6)-threonylcarbamoyltransferase complex dimerization subunit type 1 TsaB [Planctomycetaceae bacterium]|nr:MAG: tRNA (adenosine(37)-N6)-threonylcarbamoyltransferase complex dimerization subunit type 1 TsaB [Planctomycetaceae bacterium]
MHEWMLAIETSSSQGCIALADQGCVVEECLLPSSGRRHGQTLLSTIRDLLQRHHVNPCDVQVVVVGIGPGSFTGLRVGIVCAKTWCFATGARLLGVESLQACVANVPPEVADVWAVCDAQRSEWFLAHYRYDAREGWHRWSEWTIVPQVDWLRSRSEPTYVVGPGISQVPFESLPPHLDLNREGWSLRPSASGLIRASMRRIVLSQFDDPSTLVPLYLRPSAAEEKRLGSRDATESNEA